VWPCESTEVVRLDQQRDTGAGLAIEHAEHGVTRRTENLDARGRLDRIGVRGGSTLGNSLHVKPHRVGVRVNLDNRDFGAFLVDVLV
jgi:hypothetical protein